MKPYLEDKEAVLAEAGSGMEGLTDEEAAARKALGFPEGYMVPCFIGIGRPAAGAERAKQIEVRLDEQLHWQRFRAAEEET